ncbi:MAG: hypothetical protein AAF740_08825, partial [Bacteroidota bacterium]
EGNFRSDFLGLGLTDQDGNFEVTFNTSDFATRLTDRKPDVYFVIEDDGFVLLDTKKHPIKNAEVSDLEHFEFEVDLSKDKIRELINTTVAPGWIGGFEATNPEFAYPEPNLTSLPMFDNLANIDKLIRQQKVVWPEFSWETIQGEPDSRCYQMFAPDISRLGYTTDGRVYSIICPQQGAATKLLGSINVEVTVTGNRGWANESNKEIATDMTVIGKIWFAPSALSFIPIKILEAKFREEGLSFPLGKANAIHIRTYNPGNPEQPIFPLRKGQTQNFKIPAFAQHQDLAWSVANLEVEIGSIWKTGHPKVDEFNQLVLDIFNLVKGNILEEGNVLAWNVWFTAPELVSQKEWAEHAEKWRRSIEADHGSPDGNGTQPRYFDGTPFKPFSTPPSDEGGVAKRHVADTLTYEAKRLIQFVTKNFDDDTVKKIAKEVEQ